MKKLLATLTVSLVALAAFAQGKITVANDTLHLVYYDPPRIDAALACLAVDSAHYPPAYSLLVDFYLRTSSSSLALVSSTAMAGSVPGEWTPFNVIVPVIPPGTTTLFALAQ